MFTITEAEAQSVLPMLISKGEAQARSGRVRLPTLIQSGKGNAVLLSEERWNEICREIGSPKVARNVSLQCNRSTSPLHCIISETVKQNLPAVLEVAGSKGVLVSKKYWDGIAETRYLLSIPGMEESLLAGAKEDISECSRELDWWK